MSNELKLGYVIVYVQDVIGTVEFYERAFGLKRTFVHETGQYAQMETGQTALAFADERTTPTASLFSLNRKASQAAGVEVAFTVADVATAYATAVQAGAEPVVPPASKPWGQIVSYVRDENGLLVEICSPMNG
jgi:uncharacterized glyoxalase superfamily protein PhnB